LTQGRTIVQMAAPPSHPARILSLLQLGFMGGTPVGALLAFLRLRSQPW